MIEFARNAKRFTIIVCILLVFLAAVSGTSELQVGIPNFKSLAIWRTEAVSSAFSKVSM